MANDYNQLLDNANKNPGYRDHVAIACLRKILFHLQSESLFSSLTDAEVSSRFYASLIVDERLQDLCDQFPYKVRLN